MEADMGLLGRLSTFGRLYHSAIPSSFLLGR